MKRTVSSLLPIYTGLLSNQEAEVIVKWISGADFLAEYDTVASADEKESYFKPLDYWRGPVWINTNWSIRYGLLRYGYIDRAERIKQGALRLVYPGNTYYIYPGIRHDYYFHHGGDHGYGGHDYDGDHWFGGHHDAGNIGNGGNQNGGNNWFGGHHESDNNWFGGHENSGNHGVGKPVHHTSHGEPVISIESSDDAS